MSSSPSVLITGASSGIGYELARLFARDGYRLVLVARNEARLRQVGEEITRLYGGAVKAIRKDLSLPGSAAELVAELERNDLDIDVLVNNAGVGLHGPFAGSDFEAERAMIELNLLSLTHLTKAFVKRMLDKGEGKILNVASTAAFQPGPLMAVYYATKAYVLSFSEALANELRGSGVTVSVLCPGPTQTRFQSRAGAEYTRLFNWGVMEARVVAAIGFRGLMRNKTVIVPGFRNKLLAFSVRFAPRKLATRIVRALNENDRGSAATASR